MGSWCFSPGSPPCTPPVSESRPWGLGPFPSQSLGTRLGDCSCGRVCAPWGSPGHLNHPSSCCGGQSCLCPHPPLLSSLHSPVQKLVFNRVNGKRPPLLLQQISAPEECYTLAHEENVRFVYEGEGRGSQGSTQGSWSSTQGSWSRWNPSPASTPCRGHRWQAWSPRPGDLPSFAPPPAPVPQPPTLGAPIPNPCSACSPPQPGSR